MHTEYPNGTEYLSPGRHPRLCRVIDCLKTYNRAGELVATHYVTTHEFCGQDVTQRDVVATTIAMGIARLEAQRK